MKYVCCIRNEDNEVSLNIGAIYRVLDITATEQSSGMLRVVDNEGEDYLYPTSYFEPVVQMQVEKHSCALTIYIDDFTKSILHAEAVAAKKSVSALVREWLDKRLDLPEAA